MAEHALGANPPFFDLVIQVRAMRRLKPDPVALATLRKVLEVGVQAASGMNSQPWAFVTLHGKEARAWFADTRRGSRVASETSSSLAPTTRRSCASCAP